MSDIFFSLAKICPVSADWQFAYCVSQVLQPCVGHEQTMADTVCELSLGLPCQVGWQSPEWSPKSYSRGFGCGHTVADMVC